MKAVLGICVAPEELRAVLGRGGRLLWAASAAWASPDDIVAAVGRLAGDLPRMTPRVRVVLGRELVQLRTVTPAPPLADGAARRYVALEAKRLFRTNGAPLVTDARVLQPGPRERVLWAAAAAEPLVQAVVRGCDEAGLRLEALGPATEVLPAAVRQPPMGAELAIPNRRTCERIAIARCGVWRSRLLANDSAQVPEWVPPLAATGERAPILAAAYAAAVGRPCLDLLPAETKAARVRHARRRLIQATFAGVVLWATAAALHQLRLELLARSTERELTVLQPAVDSAVALRRDLAAARAALGTIRAAERQRSQALMLLADLTNRLGDGVFLAAFQLSGDSALRLVGYAPQAARVLAQLERAAWVRDARFEAPVIRERAGAEELDRFSLVVQVRRVP